MVKDAREQRRRADTDSDPDRADFAWLARLFGRLRRRMYPDGPGGPSEEASVADPAAVTGAVARETLDVEGTDEEPATGASRDETRPAGEPWARRVILERREQVLQWKYLIPLAIVVLTASVSIHNWFGGIDWGDDFALYLHQAKALTNGNIGEVISQTRFSIDYSGWSTFSPYAYPWGWPLLMTPFYTFFGLNYSVFKFLEVVALCVFLVTFFAIVRRRIGLVGATILTVLIAASRSFNGATDSVLSDLPYLCFVGLTLWCMERLRERRALFSDRRGLVVLGLLMAFTRDIRREGIALLAALVALQLAVLAGIAARDRTRAALRGVDWRNVARPYVTFAAASLAIQLILPGPILANIPGTGRASISPNLKYYTDILAEHIGLKDPGVRMQLFHSEPAARLALALFVALAAIGLVARVVHRVEEDAHLAGFLCASAVIVSIYAYRDGRYLLTITPLLAYFAYQAIPTVVALVTTNRQALARLAAVPPALAAIGLLMLCGHDTAHAYDYHRYYHYTVDGPESPQAKEMFAAVKTMTRGDDVILFARARAMTFYTDRNAIQGSNLDQLLPRSDWYVMDKDSTYAQTPVTDTEAAGRGLTKVWENARWVLWRVARRGP